MRIKFKKTGQKGYFVCYNVDADMKDKLIEHALREYVETVKPRADRFLPPVFYRLQYVRRERPKGYGKLFAVLGSVAASVAVFVFIVVAIINGITSLPGTDSRTPYTLAELTAAKADGQALAEYGSLFPSVEASERIYTVYKAKDKNDVLIVSQRCRFLTLQGVVEYVAYADVGGRLKDYRNFARLAYYGDGIRLGENYSDGEYYTNAYYKKDGVAVYILIMSPGSGAGGYIL